MVLYYKYIEDYHERVEYLLESGDFYTVLDGSTVITIGGVFFPLYPGLGEVLQLPSIHVYKARKRYCIAVKKVLESIELRYKLRRLQTQCLNDSLHNRWMTYLGYEKEGVLKQFGPDGEDYALYAKVFDYGN